MSAHEILQNMLVGAGAIMAVLLLLANMGNYDSWMKLRVRVHEQDIQLGEHADRIKRLEQELAERIMEQERHATRLMHLENWVSGHAGAHSPVAEPFEPI